MPHFFVLVKALQYSLTCTAFRLAFLTLGWFKKEGLNVQALKINRQAYREDLRLNFSEHPETRFSIYQ